MFPLITFFTGVIAGAVGVRLVKNAVVSRDRTAAVRDGVAGVGATVQAGAGKAQTAVREATITSLLAIERTSADLRSRLIVAPADTPADPAQAPAEDGTVAAPDAAVPPSAAPPSAAPPSPAAGAA
ncbi:hypothetical protein HL658_13975 [Azospirillum sp. RWY-5-1]|uniref:Uncharacterized protein n=1 Tax=Azospirillum oleiclasticum TaxID=2735135 RepID=A0ABX2TD58_9PROT|nr:hypothetical protein [Azospirillum oleiclasticum]NYZ13657.1 hypothetical protein [Azospirillum oleiclasticum]NYZ20929.1 hypothetical protein [Azospirillum oleiclasticum]